MSTQSKHTQQTFRAIMPLATALVADKKISNPFMPKSTLKMSEKSLVEKIEKLLSLVDWSCVTPPAEPGSETSFAKKDKATVAYGHLYFNGMITMDSRDETSTVSVTTDAEAIKKNIHILKNKVKTNATTSIMSLKGMIEAAKEEETGMLERLEYILTNLKNDLTL